MTDKIVTPENTKLIAEWMGYEIVTSALNEWNVTRNEGSGCWEYNLITNAEQSREVEKKLLELGHDVFFDCGFYNVFNESKIDNSAETLEQVIYEAALQEANKNEQ